MYLFFSWNSVQMRYIYINVAGTGIFPQYIFAFQHYIQPEMLLMCHKFLIFD